MDNRCGVECIQLKLVECVSVLMLTEPRGHTRVHNVFVYMYLCNVICLLCLSTSMVIAPVCIRWIDTPSLLVHNCHEVVDIYFPICDVIQWSTKTGCCYFQNLNLCISFPWSWCLTEVALLNIHKSLKCIGTDEKLLRTRAVSQFEIQWYVNKMTAMTSITC